jgi:hypothetical protein
MFFHELLLGKIRAVRIKQSYDNKEIFERSRDYAIKIPIII